MRIFRILLITAVIFILPFSLRAEEISLNIDEAVLIALRENRDVLLKVEELKKAKLKIKEAKASLFPTLDLAGGWTFMKEYYAKDLSSNSIQTTLKQYLYRGGKTINTIEQNEYKTAVAQALLDKTKLDTILSVQKAFYTLLLAKDFTSLNKTIVENTKEHIKVVRARYGSGQASESDILKIKESLSNVEEAYEASLNQVKSSEALLKDLLYLADDIKLKLAGEFNYTAQEFAYEEAYLAATKKRPEIRQYDFQEQADIKAVEIAKADGRPSIYASGDYYSRSHVTAATAKNWNDYEVIGITFNWPIFDGWLTKAKVEQAIVDLKETQLNKQKIVRDIALEVKNAYLNLKNSLSRIKSVQADLDFYKDTLSAAEEKYKEGIASSLDLEDISLGYQVTLFNQKQAIYDYILAKASLEKAMGGKE